MKRILVCALFAMGMRVDASMIYAGSAVDSGGGIGAVLTVLSVQDNDGDEEGCVGWSGTADVLGSAACPVGLVPPIIGGNEKSGNSHTQTVLISDLIAGSGMTAAGFTILLNVNEPAGNPFSITNLSLSIWLGNSAVPVFNSGNLLFTPVTVVSNTSQGLGTLDGFAFKLDQAGQTALASYWNVAGARLGAAVKLTSVAGSQEVLRVLDDSHLNITPPPVPEPSTVLLSALGLAAVVIRGQRRRATREQNPEPSKVAPE